MNLIILTESDRLDENRFRLADTRAIHIQAVLKKQVGDSVEVGIVNGPVGFATVIESRADSVVIQIDSLSPSAEAAPSIDIICAIPRPKTLKKVLLTCAMMGVRRLYLIRAFHVEKSYLQTPLLTPEGYMPLLLEGLSQGKLTRLPIVEVHDLFKPFVEDVIPTLFGDTSGGTIKLLADNRGEQTLNALIGRRLSGVVAAIGPEGGWVDFERTLFARQEFQSFTLGPWVLKVEVALPAIVAQIHVLSNRD